MSAYFVDQSCIDRILTAWRTARAVVGFHEIPTAAECTAAGAMLWRENARSVAYRYASIGEEECCDMRTAANSYAYSDAANPMPVVSDAGDPLQVARVLFHGVEDYDQYHRIGDLIGCDDRAALAEYDYQACETEDYRDTTAGKLVAAIQAESLAALQLMMPAIKQAKHRADENKRAADALDLKTAISNLIAENPHLQPGGREVVEKNIRAELKRAFPGVKFSVRKDGYSSTRISWTDGPTCAQVKELVSRHEAGHFDGMTDCYEYSRTPWGEAFGSVQYISCSRDHSDSATLAAIAQVAARYGVEPISIEEYKRRGWDLSPIPGAFGIRDMWSGLVGAVLESKDN